MLLNQLRKVNRMILSKEDIARIKDEEKLRREIRSNHEPLGIFKFVAILIFVLVAATCVVQSVKG